jgi:hypothetical protein
MVINALMFRRLIEFELLPLAASATRTSIGMAVVAGLAVILVTRNAFVLAVHFTGRMTGQALEYTEITLIGVTIRTLVPGPGMASAVDREVLVVMIKGRRDPSPLRMA